MTRNRLAGVLVLVCLMVLITGCATRQPIKIREITDARTAIQTAREAKAEVYAPQELKKAQDLFTQAQSAGSKKEAARIATDAQVEAKVAQALTETRAAQVEAKQREAQAKREEAKAEVARALTEMETARAKEESREPFPAKVEIIGVEEVREKQLRGEDFLLIDVRSRPEAGYNLRHIEGAISIPLIAIEYKKLPKDKEIILYDKGTACPSCPSKSSRAAEKLINAGYPQVKDMHAGLSGWKARGYPMVIAHPVAREVTVPGIRVAEVKEKIEEKEKIILLDVRGPDEFRAAHLPGARNLPLPRLKDEAGTLPRDKEIIIYDRTGQGSYIASERLIRDGFNRVRNMSGGIVAWEKKGYPVVIGVTIKE